MSSTGWRPNIKEMDQLTLGSERVNGKMKYYAERVGTFHFIGWGDTQEEAIENYYKMYPDER